MDKLQAMTGGADVNFADRVLWVTVSMFMLGAVGRNLLSKEPFNLKRFLGELTMSVLGALIVWSFGLMNGMSSAQMICFGSLASWGGIRLMEWIVKIVYTVILRQAEISVGGSLDIK